MRMFRRILILSIPAVALFGGVASADYTGSLSVPSTYVAGASITASVVCPKGSQTAVVHLDSAGGAALGSGTTNASGAASISVSIPAGTTGTHTLSLTCDGTAVASAVITSGAAAAATGTTSSGTALPRTGTNVEPFILAGIGLVGLGGLFLAANRRTVAEADAEAKG